MRAIYPLAALFVVLITFTLAPAIAQAQKYTCPMHPHYIADDAGTCPICGMDLVPMEGGDSAQEDHSAHEGDSRTSITIAPETIQNIGVRTEKAQMARFGTDVRSYGLVSENIRLQQDISSRVAGWVEELKITAVGDEVKKGDLLFTLYSPELVSAQQDYIAALATGATGRINSAAKRLESLGVQNVALEKLKKNRKKFQNMPFYAATDGIISKLMVNQGTYVKSGMQIAEIQDYSNVWINISVAEKDLRFLSKDSKATVTFPNLGDIERTGRIDYIYPTIDPASRTGQVRLVLDNKDGVLKPGAYADVDFETDVEKRLSVPSDAILKSSEGDFIIIAEGNGRYQPRKVEAGIHNKGRTEIVFGVKEGEEIVVSSQFLLDSESALRESFRKLQKVQTPLSLLEVKQDQLAMINHLVDAAIYLQQSLTGNAEYDSQMLMPALKLNDHLMPKFRGTKLQFVLEAAERSLIASKDSITDEELRNGLSDLMTALKPWLLQGKPEYYKEKGLKLFMDHGTGNLWLQMEDEPANPYGNGHPMLQEWPDKPDAELPDAPTAPVGGGHAGH